ncbi:hypothetical protein K9L16_00315 [Candidatus Pacearchaeota archaeon]|nr:hypothetical protein [Candidatus Pacearchaeota archaeon]
MSDGKISLGDIRDKNISLSDSSQKERFIDMLFREKIPHELLGGGEKAIYRVSPKVYDYLVQEGFKFNFVDVKDLGSLSLEERNRIKTQQIERARKNKDELANCLCEKYGIER